MVDPDGRQHARASTGSRPPSPSAATPRPADLPIFALTGDVSVLNQQRIGDAGVDGYLEKPVTWEKLEAALAHLKTLGESLGLVKADAPPPS